MGKPRKGEKKMEEKREPRRGEKKRKEERVGSTE